MTRRAEPEDQTAIPRRALARKLAIAGSIVLAVAGSARVWADGASVEFAAPQAQSEQRLPPIPEKLPVDLFAKLPFVDGPELSPGGDRIAAIINSGGSTLIGVLDVRAKGKPPTLIPTGEYEIRWYRWAGNDRLLIGFNDEIQSVYGRGTITRLMLYDVPKSSVRLIGMNAQSIVGDDVIHIADDGSFILVAMARNLISQPEVFRVDLTSGEWRSVVAQNTFVSNWIADADGFVMAGSGVEYRKIKWVYRERPDEGFKALARIDLDVEDVEFDQILFLRRGAGAFVLSSAPTGRTALYEFDWRTFALGKVVFAHPTADVDSARLNANGTGIEAAYYTDDRQRVAWLDETMQAVQKEIDDALPGRMNLVSGSSRDRSKFIVFTGTASDPGHYYYYDRDSAVMSRLAIRYDALRGKTLAPVKAVAYRNRDGLEIPSYLTTPVGRVPKSLPLVILAHGGPFARDSWKFDPWVQFLANRGYAVLQPNFRGSTGYGQDYLAKGFGQFGTGIQDDISDGVGWLVAEGIADPARVCIMGASFGGYAAMWGAITTPQLYRCAISFAGVTDVRDIMRHDKEFLYPIRYKWWRRRIEGDERTDLDAISPADHAARMGVPLLLAHGTDDRRVPFGQAEKMARALEKARKPFEFVKLQDVGHGFHTDEAHRRFLSAVESFLEKHNPAH